MSEVWIIDAARTPRGIGKVGKGALAETHPQRLLSTVLRALQERNQLNTDDVDEVLAGCGSQWGKQGSCIARMAALDAGWGDATPGVSLDRFCGSGLTAVSLGANFSSLLQHHFFKHVSINYAMFKVFFKWKMLIIQIKQFQQVFHYFIFRRHSFLLL